MTRKALADALRARQKTPEAKAVHGMSDSQLDNLDDYTVILSYVKCHKCGYSPPRQVVMNAMVKANTVDDFLDFVDSSMANHAKGNGHDLH